jgi:hypothetical protein
MIEPVSYKPNVCKRILLLSVTIFFIANSFAQVGISTTSITPDASSILELRSSNTGFLPPRMTNAQRDAITTPANGLLIYNTSTSKLNYYNGGIWGDVSDGQPKWAPVTKTTSATLTNTENFVLGDCTAGNINITLPASPTDGQGVAVIKSGTNENAAVTILPNTGQIIGQALNSWLLTERNSSSTFVYVAASASWRIISKSVYSPFGYRKRGVTAPRYYTTPNTGTALTNSTIVVNTLYALPLIIENAVTIDQLLINVTTAGASSSVRVGIYDDNNNAPDQLVVDGGAITTATTGVKTYATGLPISIPPGLYWVVCVCNATAPVLRGFNVTGLIPILGADVTLPTTQGFGYSVAFTYGALPTTFPASPTIRTSTPLPAIFVRYSD